MVMHASPRRKLYIDSAKDYSTPLNVDTSVEYDLPAHLYPPKGSQPILMIHPGLVVTVPRARSRAVITHSPTAMLATSGTTRLLQHQQGTLTNSSSKATSQSTRSYCPCGNPNCNSSSVKSISVQNLRNVQNTRNVQILANIKNVPSVRSYSIRDSVVTNRNSSVLLQKPHQKRGSVTLTVPSYINSSVLNQQSLAVTGGTSTTASTTYSNQPFVWGVGGCCTNACCNPRLAAIAPTHTEYVAPTLPHSSFSQTPTKYTVGGSPKIKGARSRRGISVTSSVHLPDYMTMGTNRSARTMGTTATAHTRAPRVPSMDGPLVATPAPPMAHQNMTTSLPTSLDLASLAQSLTPKSLQSFGSTSPLLVDLSKDSGCSTGGDYPLDFTSDKHRGLVDSGFSTPVDIPMSDDIFTDMPSLPNWKESTTSYTPVINSVPTSSLLSGASSHHQLPEPLWNLVY